MKLILALLAVLVIPTLAILMALAPYLREMQISDPILIFDIARSCTFVSQTDADVVSTCEALRYFNWLGLSALAVGVIGLCLIVFIAISGVIGGRSRALLAGTFRNVTFISLLVMTVIMTAQAALFLATVTLAQMYFMESIFIYVILIGALMTLFVAYASVTSLFSMFKRSRTSIVGVRLEAGKGDAIRSKVETIAETLKMKAPKNIIVGLEPTFFATSSGVATPFDKKELKGETLYLSLPLMRVLSEDETSSIIGHELGHFSGDDTTYSKRFTPAYMGLYQAQNTLLQQEGWLKLASLPSQAIINFILGTFQPAERRIGREREFRADQIGASVGSPLGLSNSLVKLASFAQIWNIETENMVARIQQGRVSRNLSQNFVDRGRYEINFDSMHEYTKQSLDSEISHPTDTHPLTSLRIEALGIDAAPLVDPENFKASLFPESTLCDQCDDIQDLEESVSSAYQHYISQLVNIDQSAAAKANHDFSEFLSMCLAKMVTVDGHVDDDEILVAQKQAYQYDELFDGTSFRQYCRHPADIPALDDLIGYGNQALNTAGAARLNKILDDIARADGVVDPDEQALLDRFTADLKGVDVSAQEGSTAEAAPKKQTSEAKGWGD